MRFFEFLIGFNSVNGCVGMVLISNDFIILLILYCVCLLLFITYFIEVPLAMNQNGNFREGVAR